MDIDSKQFGEIMADLRNHTKSLERYNGQIVRNNEDIIKLRMEHGETLHKISDILEKYKDSKEFHDEHIEKFGNIENQLENISREQVKQSDLEVIKEESLKQGVSNSNIKNTIWIVSSVFFAILAFVIFLPKIAPNWTPFGDSLTIQDVRSIVVEVLSDYQVELVK